MWTLFSKISIIKPNLLFNTFYKHIYNFFKVHDNIYKTYAKLKKKEELDNVTKTGLVLKIEKIRVIYNYIFIYIK